MKDLSKLTDTQRDNLTAGKWWDPVDSTSGANKATKPVEVVGEPVLNPVTGELIVPVRRASNLKAFPLTVRRLVSRYTPRAVKLFVPVEPAPEPQMTLPLDAPAWAARLLADVARIEAHMAVFAKEAKGRAAQVP